MTKPSSNAAPAKREAQPAMPLSMPSGNVVANPIVHAEAAVAPTPQGTSTPSSTMRAFTELIRKLGEDAKQLSVLEGRTDGHLRKVLGDTYELVLIWHAGADASHLLKQAVGGNLMRRTIKVNEGTADEQRIIRAVFPTDIAKQKVNAYANVLIAAREQHITRDDFVDWLKRSGGINKIRLSRAQGNGAKAETAKQKVARLKVAAEQKLKAATPLATLQSAELSAWLDDAPLGESTVLLAEKTAADIVSIKAVVLDEHAIGVAKVAYVEMILMADGATTTSRPPSVDTHADAAELAATASVA